MTARVPRVAAGRLAAAELQPVVVDIEGRGELTLALRTDVYVEVGANEVLPEVELGVRARFAVERDQHQALEASRDEIRRKAERRTRA